MQFKPICQRDKLQDGADRDTDYDYDYDDYDDDDKSEDLVVQPEGDKCLVENAKIAKPVSREIYELLETHCDIKKTNLIRPTLKTEFIAVFVEASSVT